MPGRFVDLSHALADGMPAYPGLPPARIGAIADHSASRAHYGGAAEFYLGQVDMPCNVGTYIDAPFHRFREGADLAAIDINCVAGLDGVVISADIVEQRQVVLTGPLPDMRGKAVLFRTGWDSRWGTAAYWQAGPFLGDQTLTRLLRDKPALVGVDFWNVDDTDDPVRPAHTRLLDAGVLIVEHLRGLSALPPNGFRFFAPVVRIAHGASFPVRAFAEVPS